MVFSYSVILIRLGQFFNESLHHWLRPAAHKAQPLKESRVVNEFGRVGSQGVTRVGEFCSQSYCRFRFGPQY